MQQADSFPDGALGWGTGEICGCLTDSARVPVEITLIFALTPSSKLCYKGGRQLCLGGRDAQRLKAVDHVRSAARVISRFMEILNQLGSLILGSVPTIVLFILLVLAYDLLVRRPMERTLEERRLRTTGAVEQARGAIAAAEAKTAFYEDKLRSARAALLAERALRMKERQAERERALAAARETAAARVRVATTEIERSAETARNQIEASVAELGDRIVQVLLPGGTAGLGVGQ